MDTNPLFQCVADLYSLGDSARLMLKFAISLFVCVALLSGCKRPEDITSHADPTPFDGTYATPAEVSPFFGEVLELQHGQFSYWAYSDVVSGSEPLYPLRGRYRVEGMQIVLERTNIHSPRRHIVTSSGHTILIREDSLDLWISKSLLYPYGILIRTPNTRQEIEADLRYRPSFLIFPKENISQWG